MRDKLFKRPCKAHGQVHCQPCAWDRSKARFARRHDRIRAQGMVMHLGLPDFKGGEHAACELPEVHEADLTEKPEEVTCRYCIRTSMWARLTQDTPHKALVGVPREERGEAVRGWSW